jgi:hypothetical protein
VEVLDQAATFARSDPAGGIRVLASLLSALRETSLVEMDVLVMGAADALLGAAHQARDREATMEALTSLVAAHVFDGRFGAIVTAIARARLGKRARQVALDVLDSTAVRDANARRRAADLRRSLKGDSPS